ncbi:MAG: Type II secretion system F domain protein [Candidatus Kaiserbacteria bacterium GW2011_GWA2_58_9]|uniref:Type II secretion system F domain protein n=1 Tax=Candidatus Kaiserbacteria bacterium GW2011_GWA2_58_9 TaxID=1618672 RepID=A0A0G1YWU0_9BACT|nr:MAG: Type II secretion system F domain protein [Candidatus Kaiserbacteria bacterium GW2011_GWA2_58_9]
MSLFTYRAVDQEGAERQGTIDAVNIDVAIAALQRRGLVISAIEPEEPKLSPWSRISFFDRVTNADIVMVSRQVTTLFEAQVSALKAFRLLAAEARTPKLAEKLSAVANDIQSGSSISAALSRHPDVFSPFYINMVRAGEEAGKLDETFSFLADYLDRNYEITQKARNALIYPAFIVLTFLVVMGLMMTLVIPNLASMLSEVGQDVPVVTKVVIGISGFLTRYILLFLFLLVAGGVFMYRFSRTEGGREMLSRARLQVPAVGGIYKKLFLSRIADNLSTMLKSGVQVLRGLEITGSVVGDAVYEKVLIAAASDVKGGLPVSEAFRKHPEVPGIVVAMLKIGEETGNMGHILDTMARFYRREVNLAVDTLVGLIEPFMIVMLAVGVAALLASVLLPIYNIAAGF